MNYYKYQMIKNTKHPEEDSRIEGLFNCHAIYSSRANFNDPLDSKIKFIEPTVEEIEQLIAELEGDATYHFESFINDGNLTSKGKDELVKYQVHLNKLFDEEYFFYCISSLGTSNLMWSHYADSHYGFCIEFKDTFCSEMDKVIYENKIPTLNMIDCIRFELKAQGWSISTNVVGRDLWNAIRTKYDEWNYESEYRLYAWEDMIDNAIEKNEKFIKIKYLEEMVESVVFGYRMDEKLKKYIIDNIPYKVNFKQSILTDDGFKNVDYSIS